MAEEKARDPTPQEAKPVSIPLAKIHDLPGSIFAPPSEKSLEALTSSIVLKGVQEPVVLRQREDGEFQIVSGNRRRKASELAKKTEIPAFVYDMTEKEARDFRLKDNAQGKPPGKLLTEAEIGKKAEPKEPSKEQPKPENAATEPTEKSEDKSSATKAAEPAVTGPAALGPTGTQITKIFDGRLTPPDDKALKDLPAPKDGESYFITLHPAYLEKSKFNTVSVDVNSDDYRELKKSIELNGVKDPVLTRINPEGGLEILSGQRRHMIARELNYPVPAIIQKIDDNDAMILVADSNLHRPHISTYDLSRTLRNKMTAMKRKAGRKKRGAPSADELNSDAVLAREMGISISKLNRILRLSEATKDVCEAVDDNSIELSIASEISFLKPKNQDEVIRLSCLGYKPSVSPVPILYEAPPGSAKGCFNHVTGEIYIRPEMSQRQTVKTMLHEISHAMLHRRTGNDTPAKERHTREVEAESVAYVVCQHFGIDTSDYSFGYVAGWSKGKELDELKASLDTIRSCAANLIDAMEQRCPSLCTQRNQTVQQER